MPHLETAGNRLFYFERGTEGTPLLFIHGAGGAHSNWLALIKQLQPRRCMALDLPGHGLSSGNGGDTIEAYDEVVKNFASSLLSDAKAVLVGHSMGGLIATCFASQNPNLAAALILVSSGFSSPSPPPIQVPPKEEICRMLYSKEELIQECIKQRLFMLDRPEVLLKDLQAAARFEYAKYKVNENIPAFALTGENDRRVTLQATQTAAKFLNASLEIIPDCGHMPMIEKPTDTSKAILKFLNAHPI
ncbi:MAG: alpha/beta hydrolase [candidate division Zixibacteria bacterium]|nr:alpha/beta hydrolase [candidate division Zixibacteria bacterium]MCI0595114.1 alpha/beta hydrolase [candidate division Zixibacteria bacterium]